jgi:hypothetical protein
MILTKHARRRMQQRAIPPFVVELYERFGSEGRHLKADILYFDKAARLRIKAEFGSGRGLSLIEKYLDAYVCADGDIVITAGHRTTRFKSGVVRRSDAH